MFGEILQSYILNFFFLLYGFAPYYLIIGLGFFIVGYITSLFFNYAVGLRK